MKIQKKLVKLLDPTFGLPSDTILIKKSFYGSEIMIQSRVKILLAVSKLLNFYNGWTAPSAR